MKIILNMMLHPKISKVHSNCKMFACLLIVAMKSWSKKYIKVIKNLKFCNMYVLVKLYNYKLMLTFHLHNYFHIHVCPSLRRRRPSVVPSHFRFLSCSEFQKPSQTAAERGVAELRILDFKTTWSEFQKASLTAAE